MNGKDAEKMLDEVCITVNNNTIPFDTESQFKTSGMRLGTPAMTTRGLKEDDFTLIGQLIAKILKGEIKKSDAKKEIKKITTKYPLQYALIFSEKE